MKAKGMDKVITGIVFDSVESVLGACLQCENRAKCNEVGNALVCAFAQEGVKQRVLHLVDINFTHRNTSGDGISKDLLIS